MTLAEHLLKAQQRWPTFDVGHAFLARLNSGIVEQGELEAFAAEDFYLACGALKAVPAALVEVERVLAEQFRAMGHFRLTPAQLEEVRAALFSALVVAGAGRPRLERYLGRGPLAGWLRVVATREVLSWMRQHRHAPSLDDDALLGTMESPAEGLELAHLKEKYRGQCAAAFRASIQALEPRQRNLLRQHYLDELSLEDLASLYRVHRATVARWLAGARADVLEKTREQIRVGLGLEASEVDSIVRLVNSRFDFSAGVFLSEVVPRPPSG